jgi:hypothetical protein
MEVSGSNPVSQAEKKKAPHSSAVPKRNAVNPLKRFPVFKIRIPYSLFVLVLIPLCNAPGEMLPGKALAGRPGTFPPDGVFNSPDGRAYSGIE